MRLSNSIVVLLTGLVSLAASAPVHDSEAKHSEERRAYCENTPTARNCWGNFNIDDDVTYSWPNTGTTRYYNFNVKFKTLAPDGVEKRMMVVNDQYPGPTIEANWGDNVQVTVCNYLDTNGTGIHFHGVRQLNTNYADGATSQTECPIAPGDCHTYKWKATQHGSSWYHSHYSIQYGEGVLGPIVIHGPNTANWDIDLGPLLLTDYYHESIFELATRPLVKALGIPPIAVNGLINGKNVHHDGGQRHELNFAPGKKHLIRLVNTGSEVIFRFAIDKHKMTVVAMDFVSIQPYETKTLLIAIGQRFDVIVEADQPAADYWARAVPMLSCFAINLMPNDVRAIVRYSESSTAEPSATTSIPWAMLDTCKDEDLANLVPYIPHAVGPSAVTKDFNAVLLSNPNESYALRWSVGNPAPYKPPKNNPIAKQIFDTPLATISDDYNPVDLSHLSGTNWIYIVIESFLPLPHPIHLHGHDSYILARGGGLYLSSIAELALVNPPRRDTINLPSSGFVVLAFETDNPGSWLLHCHIEWHLHDGFAMSIIERPRSEIRGSYPAAEQNEMRRVCRNWAASGLESRN